ncbi:MAG: pentapeptide repeat-containing protein [Thermonemataceae bacterium]
MLNHESSQVSAQYFIEVRSFNNKENWQQHLNTLLEQTTSCYLIENGRISSSNAHKRAVFASYVLIETSHFKNFYKDYEEDWKVAEQCPYVQKKVTGLIAVECYYNFSEILFILLKISLGRVLLNRVKYLEVYNFIEERALPHHRWYWFRDSTLQKYLFDFTLIPNYFDDTYQKLQKEFERHNYPQTWIDTQDKEKIVVTDKRANDFKVIIWVISWDNQELQYYLLRECDNNNFFTKKVLNNRKSISLEFEKSLKERWNTTFGKEVEEKVLQLWNTSPAPLDADEKLLAITEAFNDKYLERGETDLRGIQLTNHHFNEQEITGVFDFSRFKNVTFSNTLFQNATFRNVYIDDSTFENTEFQATSFFNCTVEQSTFDNCNFQGCSFFNVDIKNTTITETSLNSIFSVDLNLINTNNTTSSFNFCRHPLKNTLPNIYLNLQKSTFRDCNFFIENDWEQISFNSSIIENCSFQQRAVKWDVIDLSNITLSNSFFKDFYLNQSVFIQADLTNANLSGTNLENANFQDANLTSTNFKNASLKNANLLSADLTDTNFEGADLEGANFKEAWALHVQRKITQYSLHTTQPLRLPRNKWWFLPERIVYAQVENPMTDLKAFEPATLTFVAKTQNAETEEDFYYRIAQVSTIITDVEEEVVGFELVNGFQVRLPFATQHFPKEMKIVIERKNVVVKER